MFDCCIINHELDLLDIRLNTLDEVVERFVIVESPITHSGKPKKMWFTENKHLFEKFLPKIIHLVYEGILIDDPANNTHIVWYNENQQRDTILKALEVAKPTDNLLYIADIDEIPKPEKLLEAKALHISTGMPINFALDQCLYYLNYNFKGFKQIRGSMLYNPDEADAVHKRIFNQNCGTPSALRWHMVASGYENDFPTVHDAGWHFSTLGDTNSIRYKLESNAHRFCDTEEYKDPTRIKQFIENGMHVYDMDRYVGTTLQKRELEFLPIYVQNNIEKFKKYILF